MSMYDSSQSPAVRWYDLRNESRIPDLDFWLSEGVKVSGEVLELACGNGRILLPMARAGVAITGLDLWDAMLNDARRKLASEPTEVQDRVTLVQGDMTTFDLGKQFELVYIPFNSFLLIPDREKQREALLRIREHIAPGGRGVIQVFDPSLDIISHYTGPESGKLKKESEFTDPETGYRVVIWDSRRYDLTNQIVEQDWVFEEFDEAGYSVGRQRTTFKLRYLFRWEMHYLLESCGFEVLNLYGGFDRSPYAAGKWQIWEFRPRP